MCILQNWPHFTDGQAATSPVLANMQKPSPIQNVMCLIHRQKAGFFGNFGMHGFQPCNHRTFYF